MTGVFGNLGIDPFYAFLILLILQVALLVILVLVYDKYKHLEKVFNTFMKGKSLEESIFERFDKIDEVVDQVEENREEIAELYNKMKTHYQKVGIVKYDAFHEMGGELSFAITMLDENNTGWILNIMHSRQGCYAYVKDIGKGESTIQLAEEERESLEKAIFQEK